MPKKKGKEEMIILERVPNQTVVININPLPITIIQQAPPISLPPFRSFVPQISAAAPQPPAPQQPTKSLFCSRTLEDLINNWPYTVNLYQNHKLARSTYSERYTIMKRYWELGADEFWQRYGSMTVSKCLQVIRKERRDQLNMLSEAVELINHINK